MTMYQRMGRVLAGIVFVAGTIVVTGCADNTTSMNQDGQSAKTGQKCSSGSDKPCSKDAKERDPDCKKPCCKKKKK